MNQADNLSIRIGISPEISEPGKIVSKLIPYKDFTDKRLLNIAIKPTVTAAKAPFHVVFKKGIIKMAEKKTINNAAKMFIQKKINSYC